MQLFYNTPIPYVGRHFCCQISKYGSERDRRAKKRFETLQKYAILYLCVCFGGTAVYVMWFLIFLLSSKPPRARLRGQIDFPTHNVNNSKRKKRRATGAKTTNILLLCTIIIIIIIVSCPRGIWRLCVQRRKGQKEWTSLGCLHTTQRIPDAHITGAVIRGHYTHIGI